MIRARRIGAAALAGAGLASAAAAGPHHEGGYPPGLMSAWASGVAELVRGPRDRAQPGLGNASFGAAANALGPATNDRFHVVSLGDGGRMTLAFASGIGNGPGDDFAVYENGWWPSDEGMFAEFAFVEVSSDGQSFARFDSECLRTEPVSGPDGDLVDPSDYHNLGGKHPLGEGTGFDLAELAGHPLVAAGLLDLANVTHVRLVDVVGDGSTFDRNGNEVWDPYATPFESGGFDVEAVGVLHLPEPGAAACAGACAIALAGLARRRSRGSCGRGG